MTAPHAFLATLSEADLAALASRWIVRAYRQDELIIAHGESGRDVFFVLEGRARAILYGENGREVAYSDIGPGDIFGELASIDGRARSASIVALEQTRAARISPTAFREFVSSNPAFAWALLQHLTILIRRLTDRVYEFSTLVVRQRLICELLRRAEESGQAEGGASLSPAPTHFELAASISTHREAVSREMSALAKRGLIERSGRSLVLRDLAALGTLAGRDHEQSRVFS
ncbi:Crp/Fnr family transcriptional regulator [Arvimicrobium flavum]|uniref:Crp/Fnr family transcriptional regulator n=1 Tax=Arvimicrobium flavum TaxID=3393320 RepID=UPI00237B2252|nr:Crp/Fnr family transcriptional regulator [Mesorhizobium shangrilense]